MAKRPNAFTLIELLIVVAIIAILAAIAVPNFLEAQTRSKVAKVKGDLRTQATAIEAYVVDWNALPRDSDSGLDVGNDTGSSAAANGATQLTSPVAYMSSLLSDPFMAGQVAVANVGSVGNFSQGYRIGSGQWSYTAAPSKDNQNSFETFLAKGPTMAYVTFSPGPDKIRCRNSYKCFPWKPLDNGSSDAKPGIPSYWEDYDPTNGTVSSGDVYRFGGQYLSGNWDRNAEGAGPRGPEQN